MLAARANQVEAMRALIAGGADPKLKAQDGSTLLMAAAGSGHLEAVKFAYEYDPDVKAVTDTGTTVMHSAVTFTLTNSTQDESVKSSSSSPIKARRWMRKRAGRTPIAVADILPIDKAVTF